jgi:hypothetical protein
LLSWHAHSFAASASVQASSDPDRAASQAVKPGAAKAFELTADHLTGCRVELPFAQPGMLVRWTGTCVDGLADGEGALTSSHGAVAVGTFSQGVLVEGEGRVTFKTNSGMYTATAYRRSPGKSFLFNSLPRLPGDPTMTLTPAAALAGDWIWTSSSDSGTCRGVDNIAIDGRRTLRFGGDTEEDGVTVYRDVRDATLFRVLSTSLSRSGVGECLLNGRIGDTRVFLVRFKDDTHTDGCLSADGSLCFAQWRRASIGEADKPATAAAVSSGVEK